MATKKAAVTETPVLVETSTEVPVEIPENVDTKESRGYIDLVRFKVKDLPLASQINTLLDEVERLSKIQ